MKHTILGTLLSALTLLLTGCGQSSGVASSAAVTTGGTQGTGRINIQATDKPFNFALLESAVVHIDRVRVHNSSIADSGFTDLKLDGVLELDLVKLRNGVTKFMLDDSLLAGDYRQLRLHVQSARIELINGNVYSTSNGGLKINSQSNSGFKVFVDPPIQIVADQETRVLLDFDLSKTFKAIPASNPANANFFMFHPVLRVANLAETGDLEGIVEQDDADDNRIPVDEAMVHLLEVGELDLDQSLSTTMSDPDGTYAFLGVDPGLYDVVATKDDFEGRVDSVIISVGSVTTVDLRIE